MGSNVNPAVTVIGIGNTLYTDEGIGIHVLPLLRGALAETEGVEIVEGSTDGIRLLGPVEEAECLIILDAVNGGQPPGSLYELRDEAIPAYCGAKMSVHQLGFQEVLFAARIRDRLPSRMVLFGVQPGSLEFGIGLSPAGEAALVPLMERVCRQISDWRCGGHGPQAIHEGAGHGAL
ncbi:HyaD/HybD family hydrogenase maturation endopeptidase [Gorillibacterium sp. sgz5001074]|uniref:HyaD/HybD family hydrogenase maturation endopeptidase n=1 Tax=Gorillibacterium sp. sgz5001074 TaxID=3446695 RepID=UPI003F67E40D